MVYKPETSYRCAFCGRVVPIGWGGWHLTGDDRRMCMVCALEYVRSLPTTETWTNLPEPPPAPLFLDDG